MIVNSILSLSFCRYYYLAFKAHETPLGSRENCLAILEKSKLDNWILGKTKVEGANTFSRIVYFYKSCLIVVQKYCMNEQKSKEFAPISFPGYGSTLPSQLS